MRRFSVRQGRRVLGLGLAVAAVSALAACGSIDSMVDKVTGGGRPDPAPQPVQTLTPEQQRELSIVAAQQSCPPIEVRGDTHVLTVYARGQEGDPSGLRYQATMRQWARECFHSGEMVAIKVGLAGRVVAGPAGVDGPVELPVRIAVTNSDNAAIQSELVPVTVTLSETDKTEGWSTVVDGLINVSALEARKVYIGFDDEAAKKRR